MSQVHRFGWLGAALVVIPVLVGACGDNGTPVRKLTITDPVTHVGTQRLLCLGDDHNTVLAGVQYSVHVVTEGFADGASVLIALDGATPDPQIAKPVSGGQVVFADFTFPEGNHSLAAWSADGQIKSDPVLLTVSTVLPVVSFLAPIGGQTIGGPAPASFNVRVLADVEDGQMVTLSLTPPVGNAVTMPGVKVVGKQATIPVTFDQLGAWKIRAGAATQCGNEGFAVIDVGVGISPPVPCALEIAPTPQSMNGVNVLNYAMDPDHVKPKFQATVKVHSTIGNQADLQVDGVRTAQGTLQVVDDGTGQGVATFSADLDEGSRTLVAVCRANANLGFSLASTVLVDTVAPTCKITAPADNRILIPADDIDTQTTGTQFAITGTITGTGDTDGETATVTLDLAAQTPTVANAAVSVIGTLNAPQNNIPLVLAGRDHAGNTCSDTIHVSYVTQGCSVTWVSPTAIVTSDANGGLTGVQAPVVVQVGAACAGKTVKLAGCDVSSPNPLQATATSGATPTATFTDVTLCAQDSCPRTSRQCVASVTNDANITTSNTTTVTVQTIPPAVVVSSAQPAGACGATVTPIDDIDSNPANGVQIKVRYTSAATTRWVTDTPQGTNPAQITVDPSNLVTVTLSDGSNSIVGFATDDSGLTGTSAPCVVTLSDLALSITSPAAGATLGPSNGTVSGSTLTTPVCGVVGQPSLATVHVWEDNNVGAQVLATIDNNPVPGHWCANLPIPEGAGKTIHAAATTTTGNTGSAQVIVTVDLTAPSAATNLTLTPTLRNTIVVGWTAPADGANPVDHCTVKQSNAPITTGTWATNTTLASSVPGVTPGTTQSVTAKPLKTGRPWYFGVICYDLAQNGSPLVTNGTGVTLKLTQSAALTPQAVAGWSLATAQFGSSITGVDLNGDGFSDLVIGAPNACNKASGCTQTERGLVYIYMGGPTGINPAQADFIIAGTDAAQWGWLGQAVTSLDWNHDGVPDLVVGAPGSAGGQGRVFIYFGDSTPTSKWKPAVTTTLVLDTTADVVLVPDQTDAVLKGFTLFGAGLDVLDFDGDHQKDLLIGAQGVGVFDGAAVLVFGPTGSILKSTIHIPGDLGSGAGTADTSAVLFSFIGAVQDGGEYGLHLAALGRLGDGASPGADAYDDFIVGPQPDDFSGNYPVNAYVFYGHARTGSAWSTVSYTQADEKITGPQTSGPVSCATGCKDRFGEYLGSIDDQDGDGRREIVISDYNYGNGAVFFVPGGTPGTKTVTSSNFALVGLAPNSEFGGALANPAGALGGDADGDGQQDLFVGATTQYYGWFGCDTTGPCNVGATSVLKDSYSAPPAFSQTHTTTAAWVGDLNNDGLMDMCWADARSRGGGLGAGAAQVLF